MATRRTVSKKPGKSSSRRLSGGQPRIGRGLQTLTFTSDEVQSIKIAIDKRRQITQKKVIRNPPPPPPPFKIEVKLRPKR